MTNLLKVEHLSKQFKGHPVVKDISFNIEEGHCVALLGPNGAGKTTTLHMLTGLLKATSGHIRLLVNGQEVADPRQYIGYLPQTPTFYPWMTGQEFVQYSAELSGLTLLEARGRTKEWLEQVGLTDAARRKIGGYSGGMKQRLGFAQALIHEPKLLILDEPVSALDCGA
ncbi:ABC transporter ATP-binding protein [Paenibacillus pini]|uniref:ABC transporter n=1 Tax=Paenibacillus pini JCM 16418 TaxID=1236976 RepID=W7YVZ3_9BACL|nr:ABC transporter ATP-binding protein [Paenibacillus pini]GAF06544.1 ABC transporter [Paenibacillus pini JCM 16418]